MNSDVTIAASVNLIKNLYIIFKIYNFKLPFKDFSIIFGCLTIILTLIKLKYFKSKNIADIFGKVEIITLIFSLFKILKILGIA